MDKMYEEYFKSVDKKFRCISEGFIEALKKETGILNPILETVKADRSLMLFIRENYINIYYNGGSIMKITENTEGERYTVEFDKNYLKEYEVVLPKYEISDNKDAAKATEWKKVLPEIKHAMALFINAGERTYQQLVCRENNRSKISNDTDYFIVDMEYCVPLKDKNPEIDMIAVKWSATSQDRKRQDDEGFKTVSLAFIEMKYGDKAIDGTAGLKVHLDDMIKIFDEDKLESIRNRAEFQLNTLNYLGLIDHKNPECKFRVILPALPEYIMLLANTASKKDVFKDAIKHYDNFAKKHFELKFFVASYAGYGLFEHCMLNAEDFKKIL
ncbi:MAG: hypothetical protein LBH05_02240 [Deferribacteraceae bacterium]|jgi:hypothetical protein|nr:hypothetical protein [Deferribacteraceae bacterium]